MPELRQSRCAVCGKPADVVACSSLEAMSFAYCYDCIENDLEPYGHVVVHVGCNYGKFPDDVPEEFQREIRHMLPFWGKTEEEFTRAVNQIADDPMIPYATDEDPCETCRHYLGGGQCRINLERECAYGEYEAWEPAGIQPGKECIFIDVSRWRGRRRVYS